MKSNLVIAMEKLHCHPLKRLLLPATVGSAVLLVAATAASIIVGQRASDDVNKLFGGADGLRVLLAPDKVDAYRVVSSRIKGNDADDAATPGAGETIGGAEVVAGPVAVDLQTARELAAILKNPGTYGWDFAKGCKFDPGVAIRFTSGSSTIDVIFCFHCEELQIYRDAKRVGGEDFDAASGQLAPIMKQIFPGDDEIQKL